VKLPKELQLAKLVDEAPEGDDWLHEVKFDGYRIVAIKDGEKVQLLSRRFKDWTAEFPSVAAAVSKLEAPHAILDGEVAVVLPDGRTSFQGLQTRAGELVYYVFDLIDHATLPLEERKQQLAKLVGTKANGVVRYSDHVIGHGREFFAQACKRGLEGIVSKRRDSKYTGGRGGAWLKTKCTLRQEFVIGGYTDPEGARTEIGALLVGVYEGDLLRYAGKVGTGFSQALLVQLRRALDPLSRATCPFTPAPKGAGMHWVEPKLVGEVAFAEWTNDGRLRHPSFQGLRGDKLARDVVRERPAHEA
jgi:bifunctional non-homologous end joining protein LigD